MSANKLQKIAVALSEATERQARLIAQKLAELGRT